MLRKTELDFYNNSMSKYIKRKMFPNLIGTIVDIIIDFDNANTRRSKYFLGELINKNVDDEINLILGTGNNEAFVLNITEDKFVIKKLFSVVTNPNIVIISNYTLKKLSNDIAIKLHMNSNKIIGEFKTYLKEVEYSYETVNPNYSLASRMYAGLKNDKYQTLLKARYSNSITKCRKNDEELPILLDFLNRFIINNNVNKLGLCYDVETKDDEVFLKVVVFDKTELTLHHTYWKASLLLILIDSGTIDVIETIKGHFI